ncbi:MAG: histone deacetylase [Acidobacteria bacterium]|nr:histone deacetylase [Acidobacteriota bacterium]
MLPYKLVYHDKYDLHLGPHVFPSQKYRLVREALLRENLAEPEDFLRPEPASDEDVLRVHSAEWVRKLKTGHLSAIEAMRLEIPHSPQTVEAFWLAAGGTILTGQQALRDAFAANVGGGFHHAFREHGEGFCMIHDVAIAIRRLQADGAIKTAMVVDTDVHQGNGTAVLFHGDPNVFTLSIHQENNYPLPKPPSSIDLHLPDGIGDADYLAILEKNLMQAFNDGHPDLLFYLGGADAYREDQLGGLGLTIEGLERRDRLVYEYARRHHVPVAITLAGGYARRVEDTVRIHVNTILAARDLA